MSRTVKRCLLGSVFMVILLCLFFSSYQAQAEELRIGIVTGLTGSVATWGRDTQRMVTFIEEEINAAGGFKVKGEKVKVVFKLYDSESNPEVGGSVTERALSDGCRVIIPGPQSAVGFTASERTERAKIICIDPHDTAEKLTERGFKYFFRVNASGETAVRDSIEYLMWQEKRTGVKLKNVVIFTVDNVTGRSKGDQFAAFLPKMAPHWKVLDYIKYNPKTNDFSIYLNDFKAKKVDILLGDQYPTDAILVTRQTRAIDYNPVAIHGVHGGWFDPDYGKNLQWQAIGATDTCYFSPYTKISGINVLNEKFLKRYGVDIPNISGNTACAITLIKDMVERAGSIEVEAMRQALVKTDLTRKEYKEGEWWWIETYGCKFDETGQNVKASVVTNMWTSPTRFEAVYPAEFATGVAPWPRLAWSELEKKYAAQYPVGK